MLLKQITIFLENKTGRLAEITKILAAHDININALSIADTADFGILRLIVDKPEKAEEVLKKCGLAVSSTNVIAVGVEHKPGGLFVVLEILANASISVEYIYAFLGNKSNAVLFILRVNEPEKALEELNKHNIKVLPANDVDEF